MILIDGLIGVVLGGGTAILAKLAAKQSPPKSSKAPIVVAIVGSVVANGFGLTQRLAVMIDPPSEEEKVGLEMLELPEIKERIRGKTPAEVSTITRQLAAAGVIKLDDASLVLRAQVVGEMLTKTNVVTCAHFAKGAFTGEEFSEMCKLIPEPRRVAFYQMVRASVKAELGLFDAGAPALPTDDDVANAFAELMATMSEADRVRLSGNLPIIANLSDDEACWTSRTMYGVVANGSGKAQGIVARALVMP